jgi:hypothetical protein
MLAIMSRKAWGVAGHLEADVEAFEHAEVGLHLLDGLFAWVEGMGDADLFGEGAAVGVGVGDDYVAGSGVFCDCSGHNADGTGSGDEDIFPEDREGEGGVYGVAEGIEDGGDLVRDAGTVLPDVGHGQNDELGEGTGAIDAYAEGVGAEMTAAREAVATAAADDVSFSADELAELEVGDVGAEGDDLADELVADGEAYGDGL